MKHFPHPPRSKGIHIVTRPISSHYGLGLFTARKRHLFILPWRGHSLIGTTDTEYSGDPDKVAVTRSDIDHLLTELNQTYPGAKLSVDDILFAYAGLRPIVEQEVETVYDASRRYEIYDHEKDAGLKGLITVIGGKYTTSRHLAEKVVTLIYKKLGKPQAACRTSGTSLYGGGIGALPEYIRDVTKNPPFDLPSSTSEHLIHMYGTAHKELFSLLHSNPQGLTPICDGQPDIQVQIDYSVENEMCMTLKDLLLRRTGIGTLGNPGEKCVHLCAERMKTLHDWSAKRMDREIETFYQQISIY